MLSTSTISCLHSVLPLGRQDHDQKSIPFFRGGGPFGGLGGSVGRYLRLGLPSPRRVRSNLSYSHKHDWSDCASRSPRPSRSRSSAMAARNCSKSLRQARSL